MNVIIKNTDNRDYLSVIVEGEWLEQDVITVLEEIKDKAKEKKFVKVYIDALGLNPPLSEMIRYYTGEKIASIWGASLRVSVLGPVEHTNHFTETVAINRGAFNFRVFDKLDEAMQWLT